MHEKLRSRIIFVIGLTNFMATITTGQYNLWFMGYLYLNHAYLGLFYIIILLITLYTTIGITMYVPDLISKSDGRGIFHSIFGLGLMIFIASLTNILIQIYLYNTIFYYIKDAISLGIIMSSVTHIIMDMFTTYGVSIIHPITPTAISLVKDVDGQEKFHSVLYHLGLILLLIAFIYKP
jgi:membrane-bound metal-dependent hydrolase YbcI (DUF457 family)